MLRFILKDISLKANHNIRPLVTTYPQLRFILKDISLKANHNSSQVWLNFLSAAIHP